MRRKKRREKKKSAYGAIVVKPRVAEVQRLSLKRRLQAGERTPLLALRLLFQNALLSSQHPRAAHHLCNSSSKALKTSPASPGIMCTRYTDIQAGETPQR